MEHIIEVCKIHVYIQLIHLRIWNFWVDEFVGLHNSSVLDFRDAKLPQAITIQDLGCSSGPNTLFYLWLLGSQAWSRKGALKWANHHDDFLFYWMIFQEMIFTRFPVFFMDTLWISKIRNDHKLDSHCFLLLIPFMLKT